jgi:hypothetical protein
MAYLSFCSGKTLNSHKKYHSTEDGQAMWCANHLQRFQDIYILERRSAANHITVDTI